MTIAVKVVDGDDTCSRVATWKHEELSALGAVHGPQRDAVAGHGTPQQVAAAVSVEVADTRQTPPGWHTQRRARRDVQ